MSLLSPQLTAFLSVAKLGRVHSAASQLCITQTAVTQRIKKLEANLAITLFTRSRRGMLLTAEGEALLRYCKACEDLAGETITQFKAAGIDNFVRIVIAGPTSMMHSRIIPSCFSMTKHFPYLLFEFKVTDIAQGTKLLQTGQAQFAVIERNELASDMQSKLLKPEKYILVCSKQWAKRDLKTILKTEKIIDYYLEDKITLDYLKQEKLLKYASLNRHFVNRTDSIASMIAEGFGYGVLTESFAKPYIESNKLIILNQGRTYQQEMLLAWYERREPPAYFNHIIAAID